MNKRQFWLCVVVTIGFGCIYFYRQSIRQRDLQPGGSSTLNPNATTRQEVVSPKDKDKGKSDPPDTTQGSPKRSNPPEHATVDPRLLPPEDDPDPSRATSGPLVSSGSPRTFRKPQNSDKEKRILEQEMVLVATGDFIMGVSVDAAVGQDLLNIRHIAATKTYWIDKYEVTNHMFLEFLDASGYKPAADQNYLRHWNDSGIPDGAENQPVRWVSLEDATAYAKWAGKRLPTQEEWEKAGRGTDGRVYPWGNIWDATRTHHISYQQYNSDVPQDSDSTPAGASPFGVFNMEGNIGEWTSTPTDSKYPGQWKNFFIQRYRISGPGSLTARPPTLRYATIGFRCVRDASP